MKYSIIGQLNSVVDGDSTSTTVIDRINTYNPVWRLNPNYFTDENNTGIISFEIWMDNVTDRDGCFSDMKSFVDQQTGYVNLHVCTHDEPNPQPCVISEEYRR